MDLVFQDLVCFVILEDFNAHFLVLFLVKPLLKWATFPLLALFLVFSFYSAVVIPGFLASIAPSVGLRNI
jgi:hypothetical protein